ncbi:MAG: AAA family ATPase [Dehalococcoidia bacterium]|nr:MAG: AAA family ATPase [Dehalococcoidia bacterium]
MAQTNMSRADTDTSSKDNVPPEEDAGEICPICKGAGFVHPALDSGQVDFSRVVPCKCSEGELRKKKTKYLEKYSNLGSLSQLTFGNLSPEGKAANAISQEHFAQVYQAAKAFADNPQGWLVFLGPSGSGKTHLACAIANHRLSLGEPVFYIGAADLLDHLRSAFSPTSDTTYDELFERVKNVPLLVLDDLTMGSATTWAKEKLEQLLHHRFNARLATVIITDIPLERIDERLRGHLADNEFCQVWTIEPAPPLESQGGLKLELLRNMNFDNFDHKRMELPLEQRQNLRQAFNLAVEFARSPEGWLIFQGVNGCGKTHLAAAIANYQLAQGKPVFFVVVPDLLDHLRSTFSPDSKISYDEFSEHIKEVPLLILDDFGEQSATPWAQEKLYQLINYRYNARLPMVVTTCLSLDEIETRISSRMVDPMISLVFNITAPDYRGNVKSTRQAKRY